jgi:hypothetical protein
VTSFRDLSPYRGPKSFAQFVVPLLHLPSTLRPSATSAPPRLLPPSPQPFVRFVFFVFFVFFVVSPLAYPLPANPKRGRGSGPHSPGSSVFGGLDLPEDKKLNEFGVSETDFVIQSVIDH